MPTFLCDKCEPPQLVPIRERVSHRRHHDKRKQWSKGRKRGDQHRFSKAVLEAAGYQCQWVDPQTGQRCKVVRSLDAHHTIPGNDDPATGLALCAGPAGHHAAVDSHAR